MQGIDEWAKLANEGDSEAATRIVSELLPYWMSAARGILETTSSHDAGDLVHEALAKLLERWNRREGPETNTRAYVTAMMRNAHIDRLRSPSSQVASLEAITSSTGQELTEDPQLDHMDLANEFESVRRALGTLSRDHQQIIVATVVEGKKPAELVAEFDRPAPAISSLLARAKHALHRALLVDHLSHGNADCEENAAQLPKRVRDSCEEHEHSEPGIAHVRSCGKCQRQWHRFGMIAGALGLMPLVMLAEASHTAVAAAALAPEVEMPAYSSDSSDATSASSGGAVAAMGVAESRAANGAANVTGFGTRMLSATPALTVGIVLLVIAGMAFAAQAFISAKSVHEVSYEGATDGGNPHGALFDVRVDVADPSNETPGGLRVIAIDFLVQQATSWSVTEIALVLSEGTSFVRATNGLDCAAVAGEVVCVTSPLSNVRQPFELFTESTSTHGSFEMTFDAEADTDAFAGRASGSW